MRQDGATMRRLLMHKLDGALTRAKLSPSSLRLAFQQRSERWYRLAVPGVEAESMWKRLREEIPQAGYWPVLVGPDSNVDAILEERQRSTQTEASLTRKASK